MTDDVNYVVGRCIDRMRQECLSFLCNDNLTNVTGHKKLVGQVDSRLNPVWVIHLSKIFNSPSPFSKKVSINPGSTMTPLPQPTITHP